MGRQKSTETNTLPNHVGSQIGQAEMTPGGTLIQRDTETCLKSEGTQAGGTLQLQQHHLSSTTKSTGTVTRTRDYSTDDQVGLWFYVLQLFNTYAL